MIDFINVKKSFVDKDLLKDATFRVNKGEHVGLVGPNGAGKSTLFNMIIGQCEPDRGEIVLPKGMRLGYLEQELKPQDYEESLIDFFCRRDVGTSRGASKKSITIEAQLVTESKKALLNQLGELQDQVSNGWEAMRWRSKRRRALSGLGFHTDEFRNPLKSFSGGWQMRALLAQTLILDPDILLLDEPSKLPRHPCCRVDAALPEKFQRNAVTHFPTIVIS